MGLICACDFILAQNDTKFGFPEVRIGMIPAVIFPYVSRKISLGKLREFFLTGEIFEVANAEAMGMLYGKYDNETSDLDKLILSLEKGGPYAQAHIKKLLNSDILSHSSRDLDLANLINSIKEGNEGQEGISSFLQKRKPNWDR